MKLGPYKIKKHPSIPQTDQKYVIWIENGTGEGMSIDLDKLWKEKY